MTSGHRALPWLKQRVPASYVFRATQDRLESLRLNTVCTSAACPNIGVCFGNGTATFMILGSICTRNCTFCAVSRGTALPPDGDEPARVAEAVVSMGLDHAVITSVTRDDLEDGGAGHFSDCVRSIRSAASGVTIELLVPDFAGSRRSLENVIEAGPDVLNHNLETVPRLYEAVRPMASYDRSLALIAAASSRGVMTKSGLMLGLGEIPEEVRATLRDLRRSGCTILTIGQYLPPTKRHFPLARAVPPEEFAEYRADAMALGFRAAACDPLVRSSYMASALYREAAACRA